MIRATAAVRPAHATDLAPTRPARAGLLLAEELTATLAGRRWETLAELAAALDAAHLAVVERYAASGLDRRWALTARAAVMHALLWTQPRNLVPAARAEVRELAPGADEPEAPTTAELAVRRVLARRRIAWRSVEGAQQALLLDRVHHTQYPTLVLDAWMTGKVAQDLHAGVRLVGEGFAGVRVISFRAPHAGVHVVPRVVDGRVHAGPAHPIGDCWACEPEALR